MIGTTDGGRLLTVVLTRPDELANCFVVTAWPSSTAERTLYERPGGTSHARFAPV